MKITAKNRDVIAEALDNCATSFSAFITENSSIVMFAIFLGIMAFGYELFNFTLSIDEEIATFQTFSDLSELWVQQGRWSNYFLFKLFMPGSLIPFIPTLVAVTFLILSALIFFILIEGDKISKAIFCCLFITFPSNAFYIEFNTNYGISIGIASVMTSFVFLKYYIRDKRRLYLVLSIVTATFGIGVYQSIISVWFCLMFLYVLSIICNKQKEFNYRDLSKFILISLTVFTISLLLYKLVDVIFNILLKINVGTYLENYIGWKDKGVLETLKFVIKNNIVAHLQGHSFYGERTIIALWLAVAILIFHTYSIKGPARKVMVLVLMTLAILSPFILSLGLGSLMPTRTMVGLSLMFGGLWYLAAMNVTKSVRYLLLSIAIAIAINNSYSITRLFYSDYLNWQADRDLANRIIDRVSLLSIDFEKKPIPIAFVGEINRGNLAFTKSEVFGSSFFQFGGPHQGRIGLFLRTLGVDDFTKVNQEQFGYAMRVSKNMKTWPYKESIRYTGGMVIVKLGEATKLQLTGKTH